MLVSCWVYSTLKMEAACSSKTSVDFQRTTRRYITEYGTLHNKRCENLKSYTAIMLLGSNNQAVFGIEIVLYCVFFVVRTEYIYIYMCVCVCVCVCVI
jgi:hypothetical protein